MERRRQTMVRIDGIEYAQDAIFSCVVEDDLLPGAVIGGCIANEIALTVEATADVAQMARLEVFTRLPGEMWSPDGVYYIDVRDVDGESGLTTICGFDAMLLAEQRWWDPSGDAGEWPMPQTAAAADIARRMGVALDPRTQIDPSLMVEYPNDLTMREVLAYIAASNCGNWSMSGDGKLLLTPQSTIPRETSLLVDGEDGGAILFGSVRIIV